ncbi:MAG: hypothetical protein WCQ45_05980, partial [bacterium]
MPSIPQSQPRPETTPLSPPPPGPQRRRSPRSYIGHAQLSLVEHALCPLDALTSLDGPLVHETHYWFSDVNRHRKRASVRVLCPEGLSPADEFYLWGLLSLTFLQPNPTVDLFATPYYCLRKLGCIDPESKGGGKNYDLFRNAIDRLCAVTYKNDAFFDPIRGEHRQVAFGFLSYSLPLDPKSSRAWRFSWDPIFFEYCSSVRGALLFDFATYRALDEASRRLFLLLKKIFWRSAESPDFDLRELAVHTLGFSPTHETWRLKQKLSRCIQALADARIIALPPGASRPQHLYAKRAKGQYAVRFLRGPHFDEPTPDAMTRELTDSPLCESLTTVGLDRPAIRRILAAYDSRLIAECADMTLAARERFGDEFFTKSAPAYFMDNLKEQAKGGRTIPDWWRTVRAEEERRRRQADSPSQPKDDRVEQEIEGIVFSGRIDRIRPTATEIGKAARIDDAVARYIEFVKSSVPRVRMMCASHIVRIERQVATSSTRVPPVVSTIVFTASLLTWTVASVLWKLKSATISA